MLVYWVCSLDSDSGLIVKSFTWIDNWRRSGVQPRAWRDYRRNLYVIYDI